MNETMSKEIAKHIAENAEMIESSYAVSQSLTELEIFLLKILSDQLSDTVDSNLSFKPKKEGRYTHLDAEKDGFTIRIGYDHNHADLENRFI